MIRLDAQKFIFSSSVFTYVQDLSFLRIQPTKTIILFNCPEGKEIVFRQVAEDASNDRSKGGWRYESGNLKLLIINH